MSHTEVMYVLLQYCCSAPNGTYNTIRYLSICNAPAPDLLVHSPSPLVQTNSKPSPSLRPTVLYYS